MLQYQGFISLESCSPCRLSVCSMQQMHLGDLRHSNSTQMVFPGEEMEVPAGLNLHMHMAVTQILMTEKKWLIKWPKVVVDITSVTRG